MWVRCAWLGQVDPTLTSSAAKAVVTCAAAFNEPHGAQLRAAVTGESAQGTEADTAESGRVTVSKAAQGIDFYTRNNQVADPDDLTQAVPPLPRHAPGLRM